MHDRDLHVLCLASVHLAFWCIYLGFILMWLLACQHDLSGNKNFIGLWVYSVHTTTPQRKKFDLERGEKDAKSSMLHGTVWIADKLGWPVKARQKGINKKKNISRQLVLVWHINASFYTWNTLSVNKSQQLIKIDETIMLFDMHGMQQYDVDVARLFLSLQTWYLHEAHVDDA